MSPEFGSTCAIFPIDEETLRYLELTGRPARADCPGRGLRQGAGTVAHRRRAGRRLHRRGRARSVDGRARARRTRSARRTACRCRSAKSVYRDQRQENGRGAHAEKPRAPTGNAPAKLDGKQRRDQGRRGADRRHHQLHQHLEPRGAGRRRACWRARRARAASHPNPGSRLPWRPARAWSPIIFTRPAC